MTDYELYRVLDLNGFETTTDNLDILKEDLNKNIFILNSSEISLYEDITEDTQLLEKNGFNPTLENINILKEAIENGHILLSEGDKYKLKKTFKNAAKVIAVTGLTASSLAAGRHLINNRLNTLNNGLKQVEKDKTVAEYANSLSNNSTVKQDLVNNLQDKNNEIANLKNKIEKTEKLQKNVNNISNATRVAGGAAVGTTIGSLTARKSMQKKEEAERNRDLSSYQ